MLRRLIGAVREALRRYFVAGILVFAPIGITVWATAWIVERLDNLLLPHVFRLFFPSATQPPHLPLVGAIFTLLVILLLGVFVRHLFGMEVVHVWERLLARIPIARSIYAGVKQLIEAIFVSQAGTTGFRRVVLIEYPRKGLYALAFTTGPAQGIVQAATPKRMINCFVPTTPNPTSGFYLLVAEDELIEVNLTVEDAFKLVMSAGLVGPLSAGAPPRQTPTTLPASGPAVSS